MYTEKTQKYFENFEKEVRNVYEIMEKARAKGLDPVSKIEVPLAMSMAEKCVGLISTIYPQLLNSGVTERILELEEEFGKLDPTVVFKIAEEVAKQNFCKFDNLLQAIDAGIRVGFAYATIGVVSPPIEGFTELKLGKTREGKDYFIAYFSGPIRAAGTTAGCIVLMLIDFLRETFGFAKYDPTEEEVKRYITENTNYHERVSNLQYFPLEEEMEFLAKNLPFQIAGDPTEKLEVSNYKNLERVDTNNIRGGMCLIFSEALAQKAKKGYRLLGIAKKNGIKSTGFDFLEEYLDLHEKLTSGKSKEGDGGVPPYIKDLVAGRPIFGHPSRSGSFRYRYGRSRVDGFSAASLHPATMAITDNFIAIGTQLKIEKPTKGCAIASCDTIEGPIVKLKNGSVRKIEDYEEAKNIYKNVEEIIYLGDILIPYSDLANRNYDLIKPGYVEEWWGLELKKLLGSDKIETLGISSFLNLSLDKSIELSKQFKIPLYPKYIFYWTEISKEQYLGLIEWLKNSRVNKKLILPFNQKEQEIFKLGKRTLELLGVPHEVTIENVVLTEQDSKSLFVNLGLDLDLFQKENFILKELNWDKYFSSNEEDVLKIVNSFSEFIIKNKAGDFIGTRMGRPEKAKLRKLQGSPNILFPVGKEGGRLRSIQAACEVGTVKSSFPIYFCETCNKETIYPTCGDCNNTCKKKYFFSDLNEKAYEKQIEGSEKEGVPHYFYPLEIKDYFDKAVKKLGMINSEVPMLIKGIRGMSSSSKKVEHLAKGILRAKYDLQVNKDGTIRFDVTELPIVAFKPKEIDVSVEKLRELGYEKDVNGNELVDENQILEIMPHDVLIPCPTVSPEEKADDVFIRICNFMDELLVKFYGLPPFYNVKKREDLVGKMGVFMAPHNCAGVICRFIGFSKVQAAVASPYMHAAVRRDCDGDEAAIMLLGDVLLNFSRDFLPSHRGGTQDAPLVLNAKINAGEVDDQILDLECVREYPLELYEMAERREHSSKIKINSVKDVLKEGKDPFVDIGFTHDTQDFNKGVICSSYKLLPTMKDKVDHQMRLVEKIRAVDTSDTARLIIDRHFIRDTRGNLRKFSMQGFRCVACNEIMRRPPLKGVCTKCGGKLIFTIHEGGIKKYMEIALDLAKKYNLSTYMKQNLELVQRYIDSIFGKELEKQTGLQDFLN